MLRRRRRSSTRAGRCSRRSARATSSRSRCFWHSLVAVDERDRPLTPVLTWRDLGAPARRRSTRTTTTAAPAASTIRRTGRRRSAASRDEGVRAARYLSFGDYLLLRLAGEARTSISTASGTGLFDPNRLDWDDETLAALGVDRAPARAGLGRAGRRRPAGARRRRLLERRCRVHDARPRRGDDRHVGGRAGRLRRRRGRAAAGALPLPPRRAPLLRGRRALGRRQPARLARCARCAAVDDAGLAERPARRARARRSCRSSAASARSAGTPNRRGAIHGLSFATTPLDIAQAALEGVCYRLADVLDALGGVESVVATGGALLANPDWLQILADVLGRTARGLRRSARARHAALR